MTMQSDQHQGGFLQSAAGQTTLLIGGLAIVMVLAWFYVF
jgi:hypothetical protein